MVAEFTLKHLQRNQLRMHLGIGETTTSLPASNWYTNRVLSWAGGAYAFDGTTTTCDGTFVLDFSDLLPAPGQSKRWFLGMYDGTAGNAAMLKSYKLIDCSTGTDSSCPDTPLVVDGTGQAYACIDYTCNPTVNAPPSISAIADCVVNEDTTTGQLAFTISDAETTAGSLTLSRSSNNQTLAPTGGITFGGDGGSRTVTVTPAPNQWGTATITVTVSDGGGLSSSRSFALTVNPVNDAPVAGNQEIAVRPGESRAVTLSATDAEGDALTYALLSAPAHGTLSGTAPSLTYTPAAGYQGPDTFIFSASDGTSNSNVGTISIVVIDMVLDWKLDETSGLIAADSSVLDNDGTLTGGPTWTTARVGGGLSFDGIDDQASRNAIAGLATGNSPHTLVAWIKVNSLPPKRAWIALLGNEGSGAHHWLINSSGVTQFGTWNGGQVAPSLTVGQWKHVAVTFDGATLTGYVDGSSIGSTPATFNLQGIPLTLARLHVGENYFNGVLDEVRVYNRALSAAEVLALVNGPTNAAPEISWIDPESPATVAAGTTRTFIVEAWDPDGDPLTYAWKIDGQPAPVTLSALDYSPGVADAGAHAIEVSVSDGRGGLVLRTWNVTVTMPAVAPSITTQPSNQTVNVSQAATFSVTAAGTAPLDYQWRRNGVDLADANAASYTTPATTAQDNGATYSVVVTNAAGSAVSNGAILTVNSAPATAQVRITCDNSYELYVNGTYVGAGSNWQQMQTYTVPLLSGRNVVAVKCVDAGGVAALLAEVLVGTGRLGSDSNWKVSLGAQEGWTTAGFNDADWTAASEYGAYGVSPWYKKVSGCPGDTPAKWIWSADNNSDNLMYVRFSFDAGAGQSTARATDSGTRPAGKVSGNRKEFGQRQLLK